MPTTHHAPQTSSTLLLINADRSVLHLTAMLMEHEHFHVYPSSSGSEAEELFRDHQQEIAMVVCDANALQHHDRRCLARIQELRPDIQIILCANAEEAGHVDENLRYHDIVFIMKPYTSATVIEFVRNFFTYQQTHH